MNIIIYCDENGKQEGDCDFREIEVCQNDEYNISAIILHSLKDNCILKKVIVSDELDYLQLKNSAKEWKNYTKWKEARKVYKESKEKYELERETDN